MARRRTPSERRALVDAFRRSGMTQCAFSEAHGLSVNTLRGWLYDRRADEPIAPPATFLEVEPEPPASEPFTVQVGAGPRLTFGVVPDPEWLARFVSALP